MNNELTLYLAWALAAVTLALQVYLLARWPKSARPAAESPASSTAGGTLARRAALVRSGSGNAMGTMELERGGAGLDFASSAKSDAYRLPDLGGTSGTSPRKHQRPPTTLKLRLVHAGLYQPTAMHLFTVSRLVAVIVAALAGAATVPLMARLLEVTLPWHYSLVGGGIAALAGYLLPSFWLDYRLRSRQTVVRRALPDALDLITVCMQGGLSLPAALVRVSQELGTAHPLLAAELGIVEREIQMGRTTGGSLRQFATRFDLEELRSLASVVSQAERFGGSITGAFRTYAESLRIKRRQRAEEMAQKAAIKLLFPTLLCIFPGIFIVILGPTAIRIYEVMVVANPWGS